MWHLKCDPVFENDHLVQFACCGSHARDHAGAQHAAFAAGVTVGLGAVLSCLDFKLVELLASI